MYEYNYICPYCKTETAVTLRVLGPPKSSPPCTCCGVVTNRIYKMPNILYKCGGFYCTDNK